jgi:coproporphyrinogen III oxidase-like Fe-S oxidoreductase
MRETLGREEITQEIIFLGLRTTYGIDEDNFLKLTGSAFYEGERREILDRLISGGFLEREPGRWAPTARGLLLADWMARELM